MVKSASYIRTQTSTLALKLLGARSQECLVAIWTETELVLCWQHCKLTLCLLQGGSTWTFSLQGWTILQFLPPDYIKAFLRIPICTRDYPVKARHLECLLNIILQSIIGNPTTIFIINIMYRCRSLKLFWVIWDLTLPTSIYFIFKTNLLIRYQLGNIKRNRD